ncbi:MAG: hypothetical protein ACOYS2_04065 [Patescibacteria group bacterium]
MDKINKTDLRKNKWFLIGLMGLLFLVAGSASTYAFFRPNSQFGPYFSPERHKDMTEALKNNDFEAWKEVMKRDEFGRRKALSVINENNFSDFSQMHKLMLEGKYQEANAIREKLGLRKIGAGRMGMMRGNGKGGCNFQDQNQNGICDSME